MPHIEIEQRITSSEVEAALPAPLLLVPPEKKKAALVLRGAASQEHALLEVQNSAEEKVLQVSAVGLLETFRAGLGPLVSLAQIAGAGHRAGAIYLYGDNGLGTNGLSWIIDIDVASATPYRDFYITKALPESNQDIFGFYHRGEKSPVCAVGWITGQAEPPRNCALIIAPHEAEIEQGGVSIRTTEAQTGNALEVCLGNVPALWIDKNFQISAKETGVKLLSQTQENAGVSTNRQILKFTDAAAKGSAFRWIYRFSDDAMVFENASLAKPAIVFAGELGLELPNGCSIKGQTQAAAGEGKNRRVLLLKDQAAEGSAYNFSYKDVAGGPLLFEDSTNAKVIFTIGGSGLGAGNIQFNAAQMAFYGHALTAQPKANNVIAGYTSVGAVPVMSESTFTGNTGASAYTIGDIVANLKALGLLAA